MIESISGGWEPLAKPMCCTSENIPIVYILCIFGSTPTLRNTSWTRWASNFDRVACASENRGVSQQDMRPWLKNKNKYPVMYTYSVDLGRLQKKNAHIQNHIDVEWRVNVLYQSIQTICMNV